MSRWPWHLITFLIGAICIGTMVFVGTLFLDTTSLVQMIGISALGGIANIGLLLFLVERMIDEKLGTV